MEGSKDGLESGLKKIFQTKSVEDGTVQYAVLPQTIADNESMCKALMLALFDWKRVIHPLHAGKLCASSDGVCVNLLALPKGMRKSGSVGQQQQSSSTLVPGEADHLSRISVVGIDYGKSGVAAMMAPGPAQAALHAKAAAEALLARLLEEKAGLPKTLAAARRDLAEVTAELGRHREGTQKYQWLKARWDRFSEAVDAAFQRSAQIDEEIKAAEKRVLSATLDEDKARALLASNEQKGVNCVSKGQNAVELNERRLCDDRERRLAIFDECLRGNDFTHHTLLATVKSLHDAPLGREIEAVATRLRVRRFLEIAYNSGAVRQQRRTTDKLRRSYVARFTRVLTKTLPEAVAKAGDKFLDRNVPFPLAAPIRVCASRSEAGSAASRVALARIASAGERVPLGPLRLSCDMFTTKGQRVTSSFPFASLHKRMCRLIQTSPLSKRVSARIENGFRSSRQAAGLLSYLANLQRADHRKVSTTDATAAWHGPLVGSFKWFFCPVTRKIIKRDPPAALSMVVIGTCSLHNAPRPNIFCPQGSQVIWLCLAI